MREKREDDIMMLDMLEIFVLRIVVLLLLKILMMVMVMMTLSRICWCILYDSPCTVCRIAGCVVSTVGRVEG